MRKSTALISSLIMASLITLAPVTVLGSDSTSTSAISLDTVITKTKTGNSTLKLYDKKISAAKAAEQAAAIAQLDETPYQTAMRLNVNPSRRSLERSNLEKGQNEKENQIINASKQYYHQYLIQEKLIEIQQSKIQRLNKAIDDKKTEINVGTKPENSLIDDELNLSNAETDLKQMENDRDSIKMKLNINMGAEADADLNLQDEAIPDYGFTVANIDSIAESMSTGYYTITSMKRELELDNQEENIALQYDNGENQLRRAAYPNTDYKSYAESIGDTVTNLQFTITDEGRNIEAKVLTDYNDLLSKSSTVESSKLTYNQAQISFNSEKAKLNVGMSTQAQCDEAEENMKLAECEYEQAKLEHYISTENFKNYVYDFL